MEFHAQAPMTPVVLKAAFTMVFRQQFLTYRITGALLALGAVLVLILGATGWDWWNFLAYFVLFVAGTTLLSLPRSTHRLLAKKLLPAGAEMWSYTVTPQAITEYTPQYTTVWPWSTVVKVVDTPERWVVVMRPGSVVALPKDGFERTAAAAVEELLRTRVSAGTTPS